MNLTPQQVPRDGRTNPPNRVVAAVVSRGNRFLICRRPIEKRHGGLWEFPGGKLEHGEPDAEGIARELHEELGVTTLSVGQVIATLHDLEASLDIAFVVVAIEGEPVPLEHDEILWATAAEMISLSLAPLDMKFATSALSRHFATNE